MKPILIIKTGSTLPALKKRKGDFEDWVMHGAGLPSTSFKVVDVEAGETLPGQDHFSAVLITGSHAMVTEHLPWSEAAAKWLAEAVRLRLPILGICYGHQLLAYALGGAVDYNPKGAEYGTVEIQLTPQAVCDPLLQILPAAPRLHVSHAQTVTQLPPGAVRLASSALDTNQAFSIDSRVWGLQFHPEFDADITRTYIQNSAAHIREEGRNPELMVNDCQDTPFGDQILHRFIALAAAPI